LVLLVLHAAVVVVLYRWDRLCATRGVGWDGF
jgi:hypothetical protein